MNKFSYHKKYHYMLKYIILGLPIILLILFSISKNNYSSGLLLIRSCLCNFKNLSINNFYSSIINLIGFNSLSDDLSIIILYYPLWIIWVYAFDLIIDVLTFILKLSHKFIYKFGGFEND